MCYARNWPTTQQLLLSLPSKRFLPLERVSPPKLNHLATRHDSLFPVDEEAQSQLSLTVMESKVTNDIPGGEAAVLNHSTSYSASAGTPSALGRIENTSNMAIGDSLQTRIRRLVSAAANRDPKVFRRDIVKGVNLLRECGPVAKELCQCLDLTRVSKSESSKDCMNGCLQEIAESFRKEHVTSIRQTYPGRRTSSVTSSASQDVKLFKFLLTVTVIYEVVQKTWIQMKEPLLLAQQHLPEDSCARQVRAQRIYEELSGMGSAEAVKQFLCNSGKKRVREQGIQQKTAQRWLDELNESSRGPPSVREGREAMKQACKYGTASRNNAEKKEFLRGSSFLLDFLLVSRDEYLYMAKTLPNLLLQGNTPYIRFTGADYIRFPLAGSADPTHSTRAA